MTREEVDQLKCGLYVLLWQAGGHSIAAVGSGEDGEVWYAPTNWLWRGYDWSMIDKAVLLYEQHDKVIRDIAQHARKISS